jgi:hypothetical protein
VVDIFDERKTQEQTLTSFARIDGDSIVYPEAG